MAVACLYAVPCLSILFIFDRRNGTEKRSIHAGLSADLHPLLNEPCSDAEWHKVVKESTLVRKEERALLSKKRSRITEGRK